MTSNARARAEDTFVFNEAPPSDIQPRSPTRGRGSPIEAAYRMVHAEAVLCVSNNLPFKMTNGMTFPFSRNCRTTLLLIDSTGAFGFGARANFSENALV